MLVALALVLAKSNHFSFVNPFFAIFALLLESWSGFQIRKQMQGDVVKRTEGSMEHTARGGGADTIQQWHLGGF